MYSIEGIPRVRIVSDSADGSSYSGADDSSGIVDDMSERRDECWIMVINGGLRIVLGNWY
jgi:hypothetical protein